MIGEAWVGLIGVACGVILTAALGFAQQKWIAREEDRKRVAATKLELVRELMRNRLATPALLGPLNELPLVFGDDDEVLRLYRLLLDESCPENRNQALGDLLNRLARSVGLSDSVNYGDIYKGFLPGHQIEL